jgi:two-component system LytT family sensor kinase
MNNNLPIRYLIRYSGRLLLLFILASFVINSVYEQLELAITRVVSIFILFTATFFINIGVMLYYNKVTHNPDRLRKTKYITGYVLTTLMLLGYHALVQYLTSKGIFTSLTDPVVEERTAGWRMFVYFPAMSIILYTIIYLTQNSVLHQYEQNQAQVEILRLKSVNAESANQLLRQQIQPHFLFNALNVLKSLIKKYPQTAEAYLIRLSDFLRASLAQHASDLATVKEELKLCSDYIEMQRIRFREALDYGCEIPQDDPYLNHKLPFFALQSLLENAIKHNDFTLERPLKIRVFRNGDYITVENNLQRKTVVDSTGSGLANLRERYQILSGHDIEIHEDETKFSVSIRILAA